jgi:glycine C-acetyltransferase/8-amino-7-oxononanoate synthase
VADYLEDIEAELRELEAGAGLRRLRVCAGASRPELELDGRRVVQFASNNYLGLSTHGAVVRASQEAAARYGTGAGASRLLSGTQSPHAELEAALARFKGMPSALVFATGSMANLGLLSTLAAEGDLILLDKADHATLYDGARLSSAEVQRFPHQDLGRLEQLLGEARTKDPKRRILVAVEAVYSMDGDLAPLPELLRLTAAHGALLVLDEAHSTGVLGATGRGLLEHFGLEAPGHLILTGTLSKALASLGGFVAGPEAVIRLLLNRSRSFIFATALPASAAAAALQALQEVEGPLKVLWAARERLAQGLQAQGWSIGASQSPIFPVVLGSAEAALAQQQRLWDAGYYAPAIRPPTVPAGACRLRLSVTAEHSAGQIDGFLAALGAR